MKGTLNMWVLITVLTNNMWFLSSLFDFDKNPKFIHRAKTPQKVYNTTSPGFGCCNIFHSHSFYVGFKHAISQFNPIFPAFGALQWNRFPLILNIWSPLPLVTVQQRNAFLLTLKTSLLCPCENHCQLFSTNSVIDNKYARQQIKCQVWLVSWCLIICS